jgi:hypothetical protein
MYSKNSKKVNNLKTGHAPTARAELGAHAKSEPLVRHVTFDMLV